MNRLVITAIVMLFATQSAISSEWGYQGEHGPEHWAEESGDFALCATGVNQSPVDIRGPIEAELPPINMTGTTHLTRGFNNGHTVQFDFAPGVTTTVGGHAFELKQIHFHTPSENLVDGKAFAMEGHMVHAAKDGELAVIGIMYAAGQSNDILQKMLQAVEQGGGDTQIDAGASWQMLMPQDLDYYYFSGSLTTPPCSEGVHWMVLKKAREVSTEQVTWFQKMVHGANARPVQKTHARMILQ